MAEKKVTVRLTAQGGRTVKAELEGVGDAGKRGIGRLRGEVDAANVRLAAFARAARVAAAAAAAAAVAAGAAMIRSGLQTIDAQAELAQSLGTTVESVQVLERAGDLAGVALGQIEQATAQLTRRLSQAAAGTGPAVKALERLRLTAAQLQEVPLDQRVAMIQDRLAEMVPEAERAAVAAQLFGDRAALVFGRIDSATLRQATQDVRDFGVVVSQSDARQIERTNDAISRLGLIWRGLANQLAVAAAPALEAVANAMAAVARTTGPLGTAIRLLFDSLGRIVAYATAFAALMAGRWVGAMVAAAFSVRGLATALAVLRGALLRTGIGAVIVLAGELIYQFTRLVQGAGSFGNAMQLLAAVAAEAWQRMALGGRGLELAVMAISESIAASFLGALMEMQKGWKAFLDSLAAGAGAIPDMGSVADMLGNASIRAGAGVHEIALARDSAREAATAFGSQSAAVLENMSNAPWQSVQALRDAVAGTADEAERAADAIAGIEDAAEDAAGGGGGGRGGGRGGVEKLKETLSQSAEFAKSVAGEIKSAFGQLFDGIWEGGRKAAEAVTNLAKRLASMALQEAAFRALAALMPKTFGPGGFAPLVASANGNVFAGGNVIPFARGGVVDRPTMFPMRRGTGLMGEAGPEAILPLTRVGGKLGVAAQAGGGTTVEIHNYSGAPVQEERRRGPGGEELVRVIVGEQMARGEFDRAQRSRYGVRPAGVFR